MTTIHKPLIVAHCTDLPDAPQATLPAFERVIAQGADTIEFDIHATKDGKLVIHHDYYLGRTDNGHGYIGDHTLAELQALDAGAWFDSQFAGTKIPTLAQVLELGKVRFQIEMRTPTLTLLNRLVQEIWLMI